MGWDADFIANGSTEDKLPLNGASEMSFSQDLCNKSGLETYLSAPSTPLLHRVNRLDQILCALEDKYSPNGGAICSSSSGRHSSGPPTPSLLEKRCKPAETVLEETEQKGSLIDRVASLERKVIALTQMLQMKSGEIEVGLRSPPLARQKDVNSTQGSLQLERVSGLEQKLMTDLQSESIEIQESAPHQVTTKATAMEAKTPAAPTLAIVLNGPSKAEVVGLAYDRHLVKKISRRYVRMKKVFGWCNQSCKGTSE